MEPKIMGVPFLAFIGYFFALSTSIALIIRYLWHKIKNRHKKD
jgi:hypothetical protein